MRAFWVAVSSVKGGIGGRLSAMLGSRKKWGDRPSGLTGDRFVDLPRRNHRDDAGQDHPKLSVSLFWFGRFAIKMGFVIAYNSD
jgi:hypothetical protein